MSPTSTAGGIFRTHVSAFPQCMYIPIIITTPGCGLTKWIHTSFALINNLNKLWSVLKAGKKHGFFRCLQTSNSYQIKAKICQFCRTIISFKSRLRKSPSGGGDDHSCAPPNDKDSRAAEYVNIHPEVESRAPPFCIYRHQDERARASWHGPNYQNIILWFI